MIDILILVLGVSINAILGILIFLYNRKTISSRVFLIDIILIIFWVIANYYTDASKTAIESLIWLRILYSLAIAYVTIFVIFTFYFPYRSLPFYGATAYVLLYASIAVCCTLFTDKIFISTSTDAFGLEAIIFGSLYMVNNIFGLILIIFSLVFLKRKQRYTKNILEKRQITLVLTGWILFLCLIVTMGGILPYFIPALVNLSKFIPLFSCVMVGFMTYAIIRYQFLDIKILLQRGLIYTILLSGIVAIYIILITVFGFFFQQVTDITSILSAAITTILGIFSVPPIDRYLRNVTDRYFFKDKYNYADALYTLGDVINKDILIDTMKEHAELALKKIFRATEVSIKTEVQDVLVNVSAILDTPYDPKTFSVPIMLDDKKLGLIFLGSKQSGDLYTKEDISLLRTFASQVAVAFEKAALYKEVQEYSQELEKRVNERTLKVTQLQQQQTDMILDISHKLQTPLTIIKGGLQNVQKRMPGKNEFMMLERTIDDVSLFIYDLLHLARLENDHGEQKMLPCDLSLIITDLIEYFQTMLQEQNIILKHEIEKDIFVYGEKQQITEVVMNLMGNAMKYMGPIERSKKREISMILAKEAGQAKLKIIDTGMGIDPLDLPNIFDRFYRVVRDQNKAISGTGLGLAICKKIIEKHNGTINAESELNLGTTFSIILPLI